MSNAPGISAFHSADSTQNSDTAAARGGQHGLDSPMYGPPLYHSREVPYQLPSHQFHQVSLSYEELQRQQPQKQLQEQFAQGPLAQGPVARELPVRQAIVPEWQPLLPQSDNTGLVKRESLSLDVEPHQSSLPPTPQPKQKLSDSAPSQLAPLPTVLVPRHCAPLQQHHDSPHPPADPKQFGDLLSTPRLPDPPALAVQSTSENPRKRSHPARQSQPQSPSTAMPPRKRAHQNVAHPVIESSPVKTKFPTARIKRIMQADDEVGKVAQQAPIAVGKALELFMISIVTKSAELAQEKGQKRVSAQILKQVVEADDQWDFLREIVGSFDYSKTVGRAKAESESEEEVTEPKKGKAGRKRKL